MLLKLDLMVLNFMLLMVILWIVLLEIGQIEEKINGVDQQRIEVDYVLQ